MSGYQCMICNKTECIEPICLDCQKRREPLFADKTALELVETRKRNPMYNQCRTCGESCDGGEHWQGNCWECVNRYDVEVEEKNVGGIDELIHQLIQLRIKYPDAEGIRIVDGDMSWMPGDVYIAEEEPKTVEDMQSNCIFIDLRDFGGDPIPSTWPDPTYGNLLIEREEAEEMFLAVGEGEDISQEEYDELEAAYEKAIDAVELYLATKKG